MWNIDKAILSLLVIVVVFSAGCSGEFSSPQKTIETMNKAAKEKDVDKFLEGWDLEQYMKSINTALTMSEVDEDKVKSQLKGRFVESGYLDRYAQSPMFVISEKDDGKERRLVTVQFYENDDLQKEEIYFNKVGNSWKIDVVSMMHTID